MKVIIAGCRDIIGEQAERFVRDAISASGWAGEIAEVIEGGARGIDSAAYDVCNGLWPVTVVPAQWRRFGKAAGPIRNLEMAEMADALIAIWDGKSPGTKNMIQIATDLELKVYIHRIENTESF